MVPRRTLNRSSMSWRQYCSRQDCSNGKARRRDRIWQPKSLQQNVDIQAKIETVHAQAAQRNLDSFVITDHRRDHG